MGEDGRHNAAIDVNHCLLEVEVLGAPTIRYTQDNQMPIAEMSVRIDGLRAEDPPGELKVVGFGSLAQDLQSRVQVGQRLVLEGRLRMNTMARADGIKEKKAEFTLSRMHPIAGGGGSAAPAPAPSAGSAPAAAPAATRCAARQRAARRTTSLGDGVTAHRPRFGQSAAMTSIREQSTRVSRAKGGDTRVLLKKGCRVNKSVSISGQADALVQAL